MESFLLSFEDMKFKYILVIEHNESGVGTDNKWPNIFSEICFILNALYLAVLA